VNIDWIILDLFSELDAPRFLFDLYFYQTIYDALAQRGILFINFLSQHASQLTQLQHVLKRVFGETVSIHKITGFVNHIVIVEKTL
jgi:spermidine synthase